MGFRHLHHRLVEWIGTTDLAVRLLADNAWLERRHHRHRAKPGSMMGYPPDYPYKVYPAWELYNVFDPWPELYTRLGERYFRIRMNRNNWLKNRFLVELMEWREEAPQYPGHTGPHGMDWTTISERYYPTMDEAEAAFRELQQSLEVILMEAAL